MPMTRNYTTLLLYIILSILVLVLPLSTLAVAQSDTIPGPGPAEELLEEIQKAIDAIETAILDSFVEACESVTDGSPGVKFFCDVVLQGRIER